MTYSRHYGRLESAVDRLGSDLAGVMTFLRAVDAAKPEPEALMRRLSTNDRKSLAFVRANEEAVIGIVEHSARRRTAALP
jgi:hypothetical protein